MRYLNPFCAVLTTVLICSFVLATSQVTVYAADDVAGSSPAEKTAEVDHDNEEHNADQHAGEGDAGHDGDDHPKDVPLNLKTALLFWSLVVFVIFVLVLKTFAWGPLIAGLDGRESHMRQQLAEAESARVKSEKLLAEHTEQLKAVQTQVKEILAEARRDADHVKQEIQATAQTEAEATRKRAVEEIGRAKDQALSEMFDLMAGQVTTATENVLGRALTGDDQQRLVEESLALFSADSK